MKHELLIALSKILGASLASGLPSVPAMPLQKRSRGKGRKTTSAIVAMHNRITFGSPQDLRHWHNPNNKQHAMAIERAQERRERREVKRQDHYDRCMAGTERQNAYWQMS